MTFFQFTPRVISRVVRSVCFAKCLMLGALLTFALPAIARPQRALTRSSLTGVITDASTGNAVAGVRVQIAGTTRRAETDSSGRFFISDVPTGLFRIEANKTGFTRSYADNVAVVRDKPAVANFTIATNGFRTAALTDAGTLNPLVAARAPFVIDHVSSREMPVPTAGIVDLLAGKVAGLQLSRSGGAPAADIAIQLRALSSLYRSSSPLFVVDGVVLNDAFPMTTQDLEALDVESIEVLKGGTASALYGARALGGVVAIETRRGTNASTARPQFTLRNEVGREWNGAWIDERLAHPYRVDANGRYVNAAGQVVPRSQRVLQANGIAENRYIDATYNQGDQFFRDNLVNNQTVSLQQNTAATNYNISYSRNRQPGIVQNADGYTRQSARLNFDHNIKDRLQIGVSASYTSGSEEPALLRMAELLKMDADVNIRAPDATGRFPFVVVPDSATGILNPLLDQLSSNDRVRRARTLVSGTASYRIFDWLSLEALASTDRGARRERIDANLLVTPPGGYYLQNDSALSERYQVGVNAHRRFGALTGNVALRGESQYLRNTLQELSASSVDSAGVPAAIATRSELLTRGTTAFVGNATADFAGKYVADVAVRRERANAYGSNAQPSSIVRAGAAWFVNDESWFGLNTFSLVKLRYSASVARTAPQLAAIFVPIGTTITVPKNDSRVEQEIGLDVAVGHRISTALTYAPFSAKGNVLVAYGTAFTDVVPAAGILKGSTFEATVETRLAESASGFQWSMLLTGSRERAQIAEFPRTCFVRDVRRYCGATSIGEMWGARLITNKSELRAAHANSQSAFDINDDGFVVPVGAGNTWRDGKAKSLWGSTVNVDGRAYPWGLPIVATDTEGGTQYQRIGNTFPDMRLGVQNAMQYKGAHLYAQFTAQIGGDVYNSTRQQLYANGHHADVDQSAKPDDRRKSTSYYRSVAGSNSMYLANFVERTNAIRLAEVTAGYSFTASRFAFVRHVGANSIQFDLTGRNLFDIGGTSGIPRTLLFGEPVSSAGYPLARTFTFTTSITY